MPPGIEDKLSEWRGDIKAEVDVVFKKFGINMETQFGMIEEKLQENWAQQLPYEFDAFKIEMSETFVKMLAAAMPEIISEVTASIGASPQQTQIQHSDAESVMSDLSDHDAKQNSSDHLTGDSLIREHARAAQKSLDGP